MSKVDVFSVEIRFQKTAVRANKSFRLSRPVSRERFIEFQETIEAKPDVFRVYGYVSGGSYL